MERQNFLSDTELVDHVQQAIKVYSGDVTKLESAIGALFIGRVMGSEVLHIIHNYSTIRRFEKALLGLKFKDHMEPETDFSKKSYGWVFAKKIKAFWQVVRGEQSYAKRREFDEKEVSEDQALKGQQP